MDSPCCDLITELVATYLNAKFILSVRDTKESCWASCIESVGYHFDSAARRAVFRGLISSVYLLRRMDDMAQEVRMRLMREWGSIGPRICRLHNQRVRGVIPKGRLLEYNVKQGWGPLCVFLEVDEPETPFPKLNEGGSIKAIYLGQQIFGAVAWASYFGLAGAVVYLAVRPDVTRIVIESTLIWTRAISS